METATIISALQTAVTPVILISGVGLLLLTMTNRIGRVIDRARSLSSNEGLTRPENRAQLDVLVLRAHNLRLAIMLAVTSALLAAFLVFLLFVSVLWSFPVGGLVISAFGICLLALIVSLALFMRDINLSLKALHTKLKA